mmetsp:Transcript_58763/g.187501  ORF Transcript_58763/g.187501 Transcript_58763/m.187501 type:complete len:224 (-) Transcript_58763:455-1126(-)
MEMHAMHSRNSVNTSSESSSSPSPPSSPPSSPLSCTSWNICVTSRMVKPFCMSPTFLSKMESSFRFIELVLFALALDDTSAPENELKILLRFVRYDVMTSDTRGSESLFRNSPESLWHALGSTCSTISLSSFSLRVSVVSFLNLALAMRTRHSISSIGTSSVSGLSSSSSTPSLTLKLPSSSHSRLASLNITSNLCPKRVLSANLHSLTSFQYSWLFMAPPAA